MLNVPPSEPMEYIGVRLYPKTRKQIEELARTQNSDSSKVIRAILEKFFAASDTDCKQNCKQYVDHEEVTPE